MATKLLTALSAYLPAVDRGRVDRNGLERTGRRGQGGAAGGGRRRGPGGTSAAPPRPVTGAVQHQGHHPDHPAVHRSQEPTRCCGGQRWQRLRHRQWQQPSAETGKRLYGALSGRSKTIQARRVSFHRASRLRRLCGASWGMGPLYDASRLFEAGERPDGLPGRCGLRRFAEFPGNFALAADRPGLASVRTVE